MIAHRLAAEGVALAGTDKSLGQLLFLIRLVIIVCALPFLFLLRVHLVVGILQLRQAIDISLRFLSRRSVRETEAFLNVQRLINLVELDFRRVFVSFAYKALAHENRIGRRGILHRHTAVLDVGNPFHRVPVQRVYGSLCNLWAEDTKLVLGKTLVQFKRPAAVRLILFGIALADVRLIDGTVKFVFHSIPGSELQQSLVEPALPHAMKVHVDADAVLALAIAAEVCNLPYPAVALGVVFTEGGGRSALVAYGEVLLGIHAVPCLRIAVKNDVETAMCGIQYVFSFNHNLIVLRCKYSLRIIWWQILPGYHSSFSSSFCGSS